MGVTLEKVLVLGALKGLKHRYNRLTSRTWYWVVWIVVLLSVLALLACVVEIFGHKRLAVRSAAVTPQRLKLSLWQRVAPVGYKYIG
jgi:hypothetical protein